MAKMVEWAFITISTGGEPNTVPGELKENTLMLSARPAKNRLLSWLNTNR